MKKGMLLVALVACVLMFSATPEAKAQCGCGGYTSSYAPSYSYYSTPHPSYTQSYAYPTYAYAPVVNYGYSYPQYSYGYAPSYGYSYYRPGTTVYVGSGYRGYGYSNYGYSGWGHHHYRRW